MYWINFIISALTRYGKVSSAAFVCLILSFSANAAIKVAEGFKLEKRVAVAGARQMVLSPAGHLYVGSRNLGKVHVVKNFSSAGDEVFEILTGVSMPSGLAMDAEGNLLVAAVSEIWMLADADKKLAESAFDLNKLRPDWKLLTDGLPKYGHHGWKAIEISLDQQSLIVPVGAPCNICLVYPDVNEPTGTILSLDLTALKRGKLQYTIVAQGVRNSVGMAFHPNTGELWFSDNGRDWLGDDMPPCEVNRVPLRVTAKATTKVRVPHFGYPFFHGNPELGGTREPDQSILKHQPKMTGFVHPEIEIQAHSAPLGIHFYQGSYAALKNHLLVAEHGSWNRSTAVGYRVVSYDNNGLRPRVLIDFLDGDNKLGRPVDIIEMTDGSLLISDDGNGLVWQLIADH